MQMTKYSSIHLAFAVGLGFAQFIAMGPAAHAVPLNSALDQYVIVKNGAVAFNDTFNDNIVPPSAPSAFLGAGFFNPPYRNPRGQFIESGGKLEMRSESHGAPTFPTIIGTSGGTIFSGSELVRQHLGTVRSSSNPASNFSLNKNSTFEVRALFDLVPPDANIPGTNGGNYGIGLDGFGSIADRMRISVLGRPSGDVIQFWNNDNTPPGASSINTLIERTNLDPNHDQVVLKLSHNTAGTGVIEGSFAYVDAANVGLDISSNTALSALTFQTFTNTGTTFGSQDVTRGVFRQLVIDADQKFNFAELVAGSPTSITQTVFTGVTPSFLSFNYRFDTTTGTLDVMLGGTLLGTIAAPATLSNGFSSASFLVDGSLLNQNLDLKFTIDGPAGSTALLDAINFQNIQNSDFATGDLTSWVSTTSGQGSTGVLTIVAVPEPGTLALLGLGLLGLGLSRRKRAA